jgi:hypothetical protein
MLGFDGLGECQLLRKFFSMELRDYSWLARCDTIKMAVMMMMMMMMMVGCRSLRNLRRQAYRQKKELRVYENLALA